MYLKNLEFVMTGKETDENGKEVKKMTLYSEETSVNNPAVRQQFEQALGIKRKHG